MSGQRGGGRDSGCGGDRRGGRGGARGSDGGAARGGERGGERGGARGSERSAPRGGPRTGPSKGESKGPAPRRSAARDDRRGTGPRRGPAEGTAPRGEAPKKPAPRREERPAAPIADAGRSVRVSRVFHVPASAIFRAVNDPDKRGWAPDPLFKIVSVLAPRFIRLAFPDGSLVGIAVMRQGNARCSVSVEHSRIPEAWSDAQVRDRWTVALAALAEQIDTGWD